MKPTLASVADINETPPMQMLKQVENEYAALQGCLASAFSAVVHGGGAERCALKEIELPPLSAYSESYRPFYESFCRPSGHSYTVSEDTLCQIGSASLPAAEVDTSLATARFGLEIYLLSLKTTLGQLQLEAEGASSLDRGKTAFLEAANMARAGINRLGATTCLKEKQLMAEFNAKYLLISLPLGKTGADFSPAGAELYSSSNARVLTVASLAIQRTKDAFSWSLLTFFDHAITSFENTARSCKSTFYDCGLLAGQQVFSSVEDFAGFVIEQAINMAFAVTSSIKMIVAAFTPSDNPASG